MNPARMLVVRRPLLPNHFSPQQCAFLTANGGEVGGSMGLRVKRWSIINTLESALTLGPLSGLREDLQKELEEAEDQQG